MNISKYQISGESFGEKIVANDWDPDKEILKGKAIEAKEVNHHLEEIRYKIRNTDSFLKTNP